MARRAVVERTCDRCPGGKEEVATTTEELSVGKDRYRLDLCQRHAMELDRTLMGWARLGTLIDSSDHTRFDAKYKADALRAAELRAAQKEDYVPPLQTKAIRVTGDALIGLPADAGDWVFTEHAIQRMKERNVSAARALKAACDPTLRREGRNGAVIHVADGIKTVVNDIDKIILTVAREDVETWKRPS